MGITTWSRVAAILLSVSASCHAGLLGAGTGEGSCAAAPFRAAAVKWPLGCPSFAPCCTEYGYCRKAEEWATGNFRDCNGISNGLPLPEVPATTAPVAVAAPRPAVIATAPAVPAAIAAVHSAAPIAVAAPTFGYASSAVNYAAAPQAAYGYGAAAAPLAAYGYGAAAAGHTLLPVTGSYAAAAGSLPAYAAHY